MNINIIHRRDREKSKISMDSFKDQNIKAPPPSPTNISINSSLFIENKVKVEEKKCTNEKVWADKLLIYKSLNAHAKNSKNCGDLNVEDI